jgi:hypothetical protein
MSPALAHRSPQQNAVIEHMSEGIVTLAVLPHFKQSTANPVDPAYPARIILPMHKVLQKSCKDTDTSAHTRNIDTALSSRNTFSKTQGVGRDGGSDGDGGKVKDLSALESEKNVGEGIGIQSSLLSPSSSLAHPSTLGPAPPIISPPTSAPALPPVPTPFRAPVSATPTSLKPPTVLSISCPDNDGVYEDTDEGSSDNQTENFSDVPKSSSRLATRVSGDFSQKEISSSSGMKSKDKKNNNFSVRRTMKQKSPNFTLGEWELLECSQDRFVESCTDMSTFRDANMTEGDLKTLGKDRDIDHNVSTSKNESLHTVGVSEVDIVAAERMNHNLTVLPALLTQHVLSRRSPSFSKPYPANPVNCTARNISNQEIPLQSTENQGLGSLSRKSSKSCLVQIGHGAYFQKSEKSEISDRGGGSDEIQSEKTLDRMSEKSLEKISNRAKSGLVSDQSFLLTGSSVKKRTVLFIDECCTKLTSSLLLQRYGDDFFTKSVFIEFVSFITIYVHFLLRFLIMCEPFLQIILIAVKISSMG